MEARSKAGALDEEDGGFEVSSRRPSGRGGRCIVGGDEVWLLLPLLLLLLPTVLGLFPISATDNGPPSLSLNHFFVCRVRSSYTLPAEILTVLRWLADKVQEMSHGD